jgi:hypothetical protein
MRSQITFIMVTAVVVIFFLLGSIEQSFGQTICKNGKCWAVPVVPVAPVTVVPVVPQQIYVPRVEYQPYQYRGSVIEHKYYNTPIRNWLFGRNRVYHHYSPKQQ